MTLKDTIALSYRNIRGNRLRTGITVAIIALGIFALILFLTVLKAASVSLNSTFSTMGANAFNIRFKERRIQFGGGPPETSSRAEKKSTRKEKKSNIGKIITYEQAKEFKERYLFPAKVGIAVRGANNIVVNNERKKTNPDASILGGDENYIELNGYSIHYGRNLIPTDIETGRNVCLIGNSIATKLYPENAEKAIDKIIKVNHIPYRVIGVLKEKSSSSFFSSGKVVITSYNNIRRLFAANNASFSIGVMVPDSKQMNTAVGEAIGTFRPIRQLDLKEEDNFYVDKSDSIAQSLEKNLGFLEKGIIGVALITLLASSIGLMNIMLVAVTERTKEIGLIKALGGTAKDIRNQFVAESIIISLLGAIWGIAIGIILGNIVGIMLKSGLVLLWGWIFGGILVCTAVGLFAGLYPAYKASKLDPIVALRYE